MKEFANTMYQEVKKAHEALVAFDKQQEQHVLDHQAGKLTDRELIQLQIPAFHERIKIIRAYEEATQPITEAAAARGLDPTSEISMISLMAHAAIETTHYAKEHREALAVYTK